MPYIMPYSRLLYNQRYFKTLLYNYLYLRIYREVYIKEYYY